MVKRFDFFNCFDRVDNIAFSKKFFIDVSENSLSLIDFHLDQLLDFALTKIMFAIFDFVSNFLRGLIDINYFVRFLALYDHAFFKIVEQLFVTDAKNLSLDVIHANLRDTKMHQPAKDSQHQHC